MKVKLIALLLFTVQNVFGQNYQLRKVFSDSYFYNVVKDENQIYVSSQTGIYSVNTVLDIELYAPNIIGWINSDFEIDDTLKYVKNEEFIEVLPFEFRNSYLSSERLGNYLCIVSRGTLFIYEEVFYTHNFGPSVRSISENYLGTYEGIFYGGIKLDYPKFTDGWIREFNDVTFICYGGIFLKFKDQSSYDLISPLSGQFSVKGLDYGFVNDVTEINHPEYLIFSSKGLLIFNVDSFEVNYLERYSLDAVNSDKRYYKYALTENYRDEIENIYVWNSNYYKKFSTSARGFDTIVSFSKEVKALSNLGPGQLYTLDFNNELNFIDVKDSTLNFSLSKHDNRPHTTVLLRDYILVLGDLGLDAINRITKSHTKSIISDELNRDAWFTTDDEVVLGGVFGTYSFSRDNLDRFIEMKFSSNDSQGTLGPSLLYYLYIIIPLLIVVLLLIKLLKNQRQKKGMLSKDIEAYIENNLSTVTVSSILENFLISNSELYKIMGNKKPGALIRELRMKKVLELRSNAVDIKEISRVTGFSMSYLKKL